MVPHLGTLLFFPVNSFGLMVALAILIGFKVLERSFKRHGLTPSLSEKYVLTGAVTGIVGARLWYIYEDWGRVKEDLVEALLSGAGFTFHGGFIISSLVLFVMLKRDKLPALTFVDALGPTLALGYAVGRLGCQLSGDGDYGMVTNTFFGMSYSTGVVPTPPGILVFPTPLYESCIAVGVYLYLDYMERHKGCYAPGVLFGTYLWLMGVERFLIEFVRVNPEKFFGFSEAQVIASLLIVTGLFFVFRPGRETKTSH